MRAAILSIGSELVHGYLTDTNATFLTQELQALGITMTTVTQVGDDFAQLTLALRRALEDADLVITTGGIGPTEDDLTREAVAEIVGEQVVVDEVLADAIRAFFTLRGSVMPEQNVKQAWLIPSAESLPNPMGTAPGWFVRLGNQMIVSMPGVPREMYRMWREQAVPRVLERRDEQAIVSRTLKTIGIGESAVEHEIIDIVHRADPVVATYAKDDGVHIRITGHAVDRAAALAELEAAEQSIRDRIGRFIYGYLDDGLASVILRPIQSSCGSLTVHEVGNAGRLLNALLEAPEADAVVRPGVVEPYASAIATDANLADAARELCGAIDTPMPADAAVSMVARISPGDHPDRARGEIAVAFRRGDDLRVHEQTIGAASHEIRRRATMAALDFLWRCVRDPEVTQTG